MLGIRIVALAGVAGLISACSGTVAAQPGPTTTVTVTAEPTTPTEATQTKVAVGRRTAVDDEDSTGTAQVLKFRQPFPSRFPPERNGYEFAGIEIRRCFKTITAEEGISVGWGPWTLVYENGTIIEPPSSWSAEHFSVPLYPRDRSVRAGQCIRGWIPFEVPKGKKASSVTYMLDSSDVRAEWAIR